MNQALSTQIPQIGDSSQQLLARMAAAAADQNQILSEVIWLPSASRTTNQTLLIQAPSGATGLLFLMQVTVVPGVDTVRLRIYDGTFNYRIAESSVSALAINHLIVLKTGVKFECPPNTDVISAGIQPSMNLWVQHSGAGAFTYSVKYQWLKT